MLQPKTNVVFLYKKYAGSSWLCKTSSSPSLTPKQYSPNRKSSVPLSLLPLLASRLPNDGIPLAQLNGPKFWNLEVRSLTPDHRPYASDCFVRRNTRSFCCDREMIVVFAKTWIHKLCARTVLKEFRTCNCLFDRQRVRLAIDLKIAFGGTSLSPFHQRCTGRCDSSLPWGARFSL
jgi:hypothetical protein